MFSPLFFAYFIIGVLLVLLFASMRLNRKIINQVREMFGLWHFHTDLTHSLLTYQEKREQRYREQIKKLFTDLARMTDRNGLVKITLWEKEIKNVLK